MLKRTNRGGWGLAVGLAVVVAWSGMELVAYSQRGLPQHWRSGVSLLPMSQWDFYHSRVYWVNGTTEPVTDRYVLGFFAVKVTRHGLDAPLVLHRSGTRR
jgi:hypothetical protein